MQPADPTDITSHLGGSPTGITPVRNAAQANDLKNKPAEGISAANLRYERGPELGRGGWGCVERAKDRQLDRDVAVKRINRELASRSSVLERFYYEARVTGQLQHPGIVPVHELGVDSDGTPFYAMKLLEGETFKDSIRQAHTNPDRRGFSIELLDRFVDICNAVAYAHAVGIIHRDLKPSNVMVGKFGETIVVDWGLAKRIDNQSEPSNPACDELTLNPGQPAIRTAAEITSSQAADQRGKSASSATRHGAVIGTPAYMSPEQSTGDHDGLTPATDIYALGVILYEILTGTNPFRGSDVETTLSQVREGVYQPPRSVKKGIPKGLAAICEKAMARLPDDRYATATEIVADVNRFIAGKSVSVLKDPWWVKTWRWCVQHPAITSGLLGSLGVLLITSVVFGAFIRRSQLAERRARVAAESAEQAAMERLAESRAAADAWLIELSGALKFFPGMQGLRVDLLEQALCHYQKLSQQLTTGSPLTPHSTLELAKCELRLGDLHRLQARHDLARSNYRTAMSRLTNLRAASIPESRTNSFDFEIDLQRANTMIGLTLVGDDCELTKHQIWLRNELKHHGTVPFKDARFSRVASAFARLALAEVRRGALEDVVAQSLLQEAERVCEQLVSQRGEPRDHQLLQTLRDELAAKLWHLGEISDTRQLWTAETRRLEALTSAKPERPDLLQSLAYARIELANLLKHDNENGAAAEEFRAAIKDLRAAWRTSNSNAFYHRHLAESHTQLAQVLDDGEQAAIELDEALFLLKAAAQLEGPSAEDLARLAECHHALGDIAKASSKSEALAQFLKAEECYQIISDHQELKPLQLAKRAHNLLSRARLSANPEQTDANELGRAIAWTIRALESPELAAPERAWIQQVSDELNQFHEALDMPNLEDRR